MRRKDCILLGTGTLIFIFIIIACIVGSCVYTEGNKRQITVTVTDKGIKNYKQESKYLIYGKDDDKQIVTCEISDSLIQGKFNSSEIYGSIEVGKKYTFEIVGERNELLSMYPNIVRVLE